MLDIKIVSPYNEGLLTTALVHDQFVGWIYQTIEWTDNNEKAYTANHGTSQIDALDYHLQKLRQADGT